MSTIPQNSTKVHIRSSFRDAVYTNLNIGMSESYFCAFMLALGIPEITAGVGTTLAQFIGVCFQLLSIRSIFRRYSLKTRLLLFLGCQALSLLPLIIIGRMHLDWGGLVIFIWGIYWACLLSLNPPWLRLFGNTIPPKFRLRFFAIRHQYAQFSVFLGLLISGILLQKLGADIFVWIFVSAFVLKLLSWLEIKFKHLDHVAPEGPRLPLRVFMKRMGSTEQGKLVTFLGFFYLGTHFSSPFHVPFMLQHLKFTYLELMMVTAVSYFGRVLMFRILQKTARPRHINAMLTWAVSGICLSPLLWALNQNYYWILGVEFMSGCFWAGFDLSTVILYYDKIEDRERTSIMSYIVFFNTTGMVVGSLIGAAYMKFLPPPYNPYLILFMTSTGLRLLILIFAPHTNFKGRIPKILGVLPYGGIIRPVLERFRKK